MFDYFNPNEAQLMEIKALIIAQQSRKSSINNMEWFIFSKSMP
jgi:hypothetical protein